MKLSIIIPCYNEPDTIGEIIGRVLAVALPAGWEREIIVVDDGSREDTKQALREAQTRYPAIKVITRAKNGGKGAALKDGFAVAIGDYLMIQDADLEYDPTDIPTLLAPIIAGSTQVVFGARQMRENNVSGRFYFYWGGWLVNAVFNVAFGTKLSDLPTCYKLFPRSLVPTLLAQPGNDFVFDVIELSRELARAGIVEVPIHYHARDVAQGKKIRAKDGIRCLLRIGTLAATQYARVLRFIVVGGSAALFNIALLYILTNLFGIWYLASEAVAFVIALGYNFTLQKLWAFGNRSGNHARQGGVFALVNIGNLLLNTALLFLFVEYLGIYYLLAQAFASILIAFESYFLYRRIFR